MKAKQSEIRVDAHEKLTGAVRYIRDEKLPDMWWGKTIRSVHPCARICKIEFDKNFDWSKITVVTAADIKNNYVAMLENDMPFLASDRVNYIGEPVVLIASGSKEKLEIAARHISIKYQPLTHNYDMLKSEQSKPVIFGKDNVFKHIKIERGHLNEAKKNTAHQIQLRINTGYQEHLYLEPQGIIAIPDKNRIQIKGSMQCPYYIKNALEKLFNNEKHITVIQAPTGGAFGGKEDFPSLLAGHAALLADKSGHPVAMFYDRKEDVKYTPKRHPSYHNYKAYFNDDGKIIAADLNMILDGGAYCTLSQVVLSRAALTAIGCYHIPNIRISAKAVATNTVPAGAFRGFGGPQAIFAIEMLIEKIAHFLKKPADLIREINLISEGQRTATGQVLKYSVSAKETYNDVRTNSDFKLKYEQYSRHNIPILKKLKKGLYPKNDKNDVLKGIGICSFLHGAGFTGTGENKIKGVIRVKIDEDGMPVIYSAQTEMGQGEQTAFRKMLAEALEIPIAHVGLAQVNTDFVPNSGPTVASRSTMIVGGLLIETANEIKRTLLNRLNKNNADKFGFDKGFFKNSVKTYSFRDIAKEHAGLCLEKQYQHPPFIKFDDIRWKGDAYPVFSWAASVAEVAVDPATFAIRVHDYYTTHEIGKAINFNQAQAQIEGGSLQGIGYAIYEKINLENGLYDVSGYTDYIIPTPTEIPVFHVNILENPYPFGPFGAKGLGELPFVGAAPAVTSALNMIFNTVFQKIPVLPEDLAGLYD